jgi:integration host factor subunit alpha
LSRGESAALVELVLKEITACLERGETVKLVSFGSFEVREKGLRPGRNPKTGKEHPITPRRVIRFKPSPILKQRLLSNEWTSRAAYAADSNHHHRPSWPGVQPSKEVACLANSVALWAKADQTS